MTTRPTQPPGTTLTVETQVATGLGTSRCTAVLPIASSLVDAQAWRKHANLGPDDVAAAVGEGYRLMLRACVEVLSTSSARSCAPTLIATFSRMSGDRARAEQIAFDYLRLGALLKVAKDGRYRVALQAYALSSFETQQCQQYPGTRAVLELTLQCLGSRGFPTPSPPSWVSNPMYRFRLMRSRRLLRAWHRRFVTADRSNLLVQMCSGPAFQRCGAEFARAWLSGGEVPLVAGDEVGGENGDLLATVLSGHAGFPGQRGYAPGDERRGRPTSLPQLIAWYRSRARLLRRGDPVAVRHFESITIHHITLERRTVRESTGLAHEVPRPLRVRAFDPDRDDLDVLQVDQVVIGAHAPLIDEGLTFGSGRIFPTVVAPVHRVRTRLQGVSRAENIAIVTESKHPPQLQVDHDQLRRLLFIRDSSGSMGSFSEGTPLDVVTLSMFSVVKTLAASGVAQGMEFGLIDFSDRSTFSGWVGPSNLRRLYRAACRRQSGGTTLDFPTMNAALARGPQTLVLLMTDGALGVSGGIAQDVIGLLRAHLGFVICTDEAVAGFCHLAAEAGITTVVVPSLAEIEPIVSEIFAPVRKTP